MKKKIGLVAGISVIVLVLIGVGLFLLLNKDSINTDNTSANLYGTWCVYRRGADMVEDEYIVFGDDTVSDYRGDLTNPYFESVFSYSKNKLSIGDSSYSVKVISENNVILVDSSTIEWKMLRVSNERSLDFSVSDDALVGAYDVLRVGGEDKKNEVMTFDRTSLHDERAGVMYLEVNYSWDGPNSIFVPDLSTKYLVFVLDANLYLIDMNEGYVWELSRR